MGRREELLKYLAEKNISLETAIEILESEKFIKKFKEQKEKAVLGEYEKRG